MVLPQAPAGADQKLEGSSQPSRLTRTGDAGPARGKRMCCTCYMECSKPRDKYAVQSSPSKVSLPRST